jgi:hypothetical protein
MPKIRPLTADQLDRLAERQADALRAPERTVGSVLVSLLVSGVGGLALAVAAALVLSGMGAPLGIVLEWSGRAGLAAACLYLATWSLPVERARDLRRWAEAQRVVQLAEFRKLEAYRELVAVRAEKDARIKDLETALNEAHADLRNARMELRRTQEVIAHAGVRRTFVAKSNTEPQVVRDAQTILRHWFEAGAWYSRPKAVQAGWSEDRHNAAVRLLDDAALVGKAGNLRSVTADSLDAALRRLADWRESAETAPVQAAPSPAYVEAE